MLGQVCLRLAVNAHIFGYGVMGFARRGSFPTSVGLIRGGYRGAAPRAAGTDSVKHVFLLRNGSLVPREQVLSNAHTFSAFCSIFPSRQQIM